MQSKIISQLKEWQAEAGLANKEAAARFGMSASQYIDIVNGRRCKRYGLFTDGQNIFLQMQKKSIDSSAIAE